VIANGRRGEVTETLQRLFDQLESREISGAAAAS